MVCPARVACLVIGLALAPYPDSRALARQNARLLTDAEGTWPTSIAICPQNIDSIAVTRMAAGPNGSSRSLWIDQTASGGQNWTSEQLPGTPSGPEFAGSVQFDSDGRLLCTITAIARDGAAEPGMETAALLRGLHGKGTWAEPVFICRPGAAAALPPQSCPLAVDRNRRSEHFGNVYCAWIEREPPTPRAASLTARPLLSRSTDGGVSFEPPVAVSESREAALRPTDSSGPAVAVGPDGTVFVVWRDSRGWMFNRSRDGGKSFESERVVRTPEDPGVQTRAIGSFPGLGVDCSTGPRRGRLYLGWKSDPDDDGCAILLCHSDDGGSTWSADRQVFMEEPGHLPFPAAALAIDPVDGAVNLVHRHELGPEGRARIRTLLHRSIDGGTFHEFVLDERESPGAITGTSPFRIVADAVQGRVAVAFVHQSMVVLSESVDENGKTHRTVTNQSFAHFAAADFQPDTLDRLELGSRTAGQPERVAVQHILVGFSGSVPGKEIARSESEARALASQLLERARGGEDFDALVREFTDDQYPGIYQMSNLNVFPDMSPEATEDKLFPRGGMVRAFGDVSFGLAVGEIGMTEYSPAFSKYGWHVIKRLK